ncbi:MAG: glycoside hydrolase N-terminal domain-containing protein [Verrucomicrobiota bacterium]
MAFAASALSAFAVTEADLFAAPKRGFVSRRPAFNWEHSLVAGNGVMGALVAGNPCDETIYLSHAALYLPREKSDNPLDMVSHLGQVREDCLKGNFKEAGLINEVMYKEHIAKYGYHSHLNDPFIGACALRIEQPETDVSRYQRSVNFMTGEAHVTYTTAAGTFRRSTFVSRADDVIVVRLAGTGKQTAAIQFTGLMPQKFSEMQEVLKRVKSSEQRVLDKGFYIYFRNVFATPNAENPVRGYEAVGKFIPRGGTPGRTYEGHKFNNFDELLVLIKIRPLLTAGNETSNLEAIQKDLDALPADYDKLLVPHAKIHGELMSRVSFSLDAPAADRAKASEDLIQESKTLESPLAQLERAFDAGRYNIISSTGYNPPNLQGLWSGVWFGTWGCTMTIDGNLPCAVSFNSMGNTPELMAPYFRYNEQFLPGFRKNMQEIYGMRGFLIPGAITTSARFVGVSPTYPFYFWQAGAAWTCHYYYDHWLYTGDRKFLEERAYPLIKEAAAFYEDFLTITDKNGKVVFVPSYSPETAPVRASGERIVTAINATMEVGAAKQLLSHAIAAAKELGRDSELQKKWAELLEKMPPYEVGEDGSFREWLWPGLKDFNEHRHASHLYPLYYEMPSEIVENPALVKAVGHTGRERMKFHEQGGQMAFGIVQVGLAAAHVGDAELAQRAINELGKRYWSQGMGSYHCPGTIFNTDISGGLPYLCASTLVYSDPGVIRFFPARPPQWKSGSLKGARLRGAITLAELTWDGAKAKAVLVSDKDQTVTIFTPGGESRKCSLTAGKAAELSLEAK